MTPYGTKTMELADVCIQAVYDKDRVSPHRAALCQHIEQGEPDCRTCEYLRQRSVFTAQGQIVHYCLISPATPCTNFIYYKRADYAPLCEIK